jgi:hypothetical protein
MLCKLSRKHESYSGLDLAGGKGGLLVVGSQLASFGSDAFKYVIDKGVHDGHSLLGDTGIGVNLLQHLVDIRRVRLDTLLGLLAGSSSLSVVRYKT